MKIHQTVLDRLVSARALLEHSGPRLNPQSDSRAVALAVVLSQDAAELALKAIADQLNIKATKDFAFPRLVEEIQGQLTISAPLANYLKRLNDARVSFKHQGNLPDPGTWFNAAELTTDYLSEICKLVFGIPLSEIDLVHLIRDSYVVALLQGAQTEQKNTRFREALEEIAHALDAANRSIFPAGLTVAPGSPDPQLALLLTGYGVDPASFIIMQQLLPKLNLYGKIEWVRHETGHPGNWNGENITFCLATVIDLMLRLQGASALPQPKRFYDVFRDVVTVKVEHPTGFCGQDVHLPGSSHPTPFRVKSLDDISKGDKIYGRVSISDENGNLPISSAEFENPEWIRVTSAMCKGETQRYDQFLVVKREHVDISVEEITK
jgi:HEPN domain-containing protein